VIECVLKGEAGNLNEGNQDSPYSDFLHECRGEIEACDGNANVKKQAQAVLQLLGVDIAVNGSNSTPSSAPAVAPVSAAPASAPAPVQDLLGFAEDKPALSAPPQQAPTTQAPTPSPPVENGLFSGMQEKTPGSITPPPPPTAAAPTLPIIPDEIITVEDIFGSGNDGAVESAAPHADLFGSMSVKGEVVGGSSDGGSASSFGFIHNNTQEEADEPEAAKDAMSAISAMGDMDAVNATVVEARDEHTLKLQQEKKEKEEREERERNDAQFADDLLAPPPPDAAAASANSSSLNIFDPLSGQQQQAQQQSQQQSQMKQQQTMQMNQMNMNQMGQMNQMNMNPQQIAMQQLQYQNMMMQQQMQRMMMMQQQQGGNIGGTNGIGMPTFQMNMVNNRSAETGLNISPSTKQRKSIDGVNETGTLAGADAFASAKKNEQSFDFVKDLM